MNGWKALSVELDAWAAAGRGAAFWWRDDDATRPEPALERLIALSSERETPLCLGVVPARAAAELAALVGGAEGLSIAVHGYAHRNHAEPGGAKAEYGAERPAQIMLDELGAGRTRLEELFGARLEPILVPPWNRIAAELVPRLPEAGFGGLSTYRPRPRSLPAPGLVQVNTHVDIIAWRGGRGFLGTEPALALAVDHLAAKRLGRADAAEPTGLLTHHLMHDFEAWEFIASFIDATRKHPAARWLSAAAAFRLDP